MAIGILLYWGSYRFSFDLDEGLSWGSVPDPKPRLPQTNALVASEETIRTYLTDHGVDNIKSIKFVEPKFPKHEAAKRCNTMLENFAEHIIDEDPFFADRYRDKLKKFCGVVLEY